MAGIKLINGDKICVVESMEEVMSLMMSNEIAIKVTEIGDVISIDDYMQTHSHCYDPIYVMVKNILIISEH